MSNPRLRRKNLDEKFFAKNRKSVSKRLFLPKQASRKTIRGLEGGYQTIITPLIRKYAAQFRGKTLSVIDRIVRDMATFERVVVDKPALDKYYAKRTAEDVIQTRKVVIKKPVQGCVDYAAALCSVLRAKGIPAYFKRDIRTHSTTLFKLGNKWFRADPTPERVAEDFHLVEVNINREIKDSVAIGVDAWDIGLTGLDRFNLEQHRTATRNAIKEDRLV